MGKCALLPLPPPNNAHKGACAALAQPLHTSPMLVVQGWVGLLRQGSTSYIMKASHWDYLPSSHPRVLPW